MSKSIRKSKKSPEEIKKARLSRNFRNSIKNTFIMAGFKYLNTQNKHFKIGHRTVELDFIFIYENIILICEDTTTKTDNIKNHVRKKYEGFIEINRNISDFCSWLFDNFQDFLSDQYKYSSDRYKIMFLYFSQEELNFSADDYRLYPLIKFVSYGSLMYLLKMSKCIERSARYEIFRFLKLSDDDIGVATSESDPKQINATIISPKSFTGIINNVRVVSFMMSTERLIKNSYVLRKDSWENSVSLYQRLIQDAKIRNIRKFLVAKGEAFYNNIIVALPDNVSFKDTKDIPLDINDISRHQVCTMLIPNCMNSICVIDGQHRIYAHYEGIRKDSDESRISKLRKELHLLVTGLIFPKNMPNNERVKIQSEIFLDINSNAKPVPQDILLHIQMIKDPISDLGLSKSIIESLNKENIFLNKFKMSLLNESPLSENKIKITSIIKFALRYLITLDPKDGRKNLFFHWDGDKEALKKMDDATLDKYKEFCVEKISIYFRAIKKHFKSEWHDPKSKILSVISINGFIMSYLTLIDKYGIKDFEFYDKLLSKLDFDFSKDNFPYTSSQYAKFSREIIKKLEIE